MLPIISALTLLGTIASEPLDVQARGPIGSLHGTMTPAPGGPIVLIIPGSGPTDRDGNSPLGIRAAPYRLLAESLASRGITSVRIDKRGMFGSRAAVLDGNAVTIGDYAQDVRSWVDELRSRTTASCVWLAGHSEGGLVALAAAVRTRHLCGIVLIATPGRPLGTILKQQLRANPANTPLLGAADEAIDTLTRGERIDAASLPPALAPLFAPAVQDFLASVLALDPVVLARRTSLPVLILQGSRDLQVSIEDAELLAHASPNGQLRVLPNINHVLKNVDSDDRVVNLSTYSSPDMPLGPEVVDAIVTFVKAHQRLPRQRPPSAQTFRRGADEPLYPVHGRDRLTSKTRESRQGQIRLPRGWNSDPAAPTPGSISKASRYQQRASSMSPEQPNAESPLRIAQERGT